jgi:hypothetical protein
MRKEGTKDEGKRERGKERRGVVEGSSVRVVIALLEHL